VLLDLWKNPGGNDTLAWEVGKVIHSRSQPFGGSKVMNVFFLPTTPILFSSALFPVPVSPAGS
jgi:hypothetical protein